MKSNPVLSWKLLRPLGTALSVLLLLNIGLYTLFPAPQGISLLDRARSFRLEFDQPADGTGWYQPETTGDTTFEWTSSVDATLSFDIAARDNLQITFRIINGEPEAINGLTLTANQTAIPLQHSGDLFSGVISTTVLQNHPASLDLDFHTPAVYRPSELHPPSTDTRTLGVAFDWLVIEPLADNSTLYEFDQGCTSDQGWYGTEIDTGDGTTTCWSAQTDATKTVQIPRGKPFTIETGIIEAVTPQVFDTFRLLINGTVLPLQKAEHDGRIWFSADVPAIDADSAVLTFHVDQVFSPLALNTGTDARVLGVRVDWVRITERPS